MQTLTFKTPDRGVSVRSFLRPLTPYLEDNQITELAIVREKEVFIKKGGEWFQESVPSLSMSHLNALINSLAVYNGFGSELVMSVLLPSGERGQIVRSPAVLDGTVAINIRKHTQIVKSLEELMAEGVFAQAVDVASEFDEDGLTFSERQLLNLLGEKKMIDFLRLAIQKKMNIVVSGSTGSGKTTFARALIEQVDTRERLITMEDVHELILPNHKNIVHLLYNKSEGGVSPSECIEACMRLSPDRIFLAEIRGAEAWDYLVALNTGHPGSITTTHANSALDTFARLGVLIKQSEAGAHLDMETIRQFLYTTVDIVLYFEKYQMKEIYFNPLERKKYI